MTQTRGLRRRYLTDEYREKVESVADAHPDADLSTEAVRRKFLQECACFEAFLRDGTPKSVVRRSAFVKTRRDL